MDVSGNGGSIGVEIVCTGSIVSEELTDENVRYDTIEIGLGRAVRHANHEVGLHTIQSRFVTSNNDDLRHRLVVTIHLTNEVTLIALYFLVINHEVNDNRLAVHHRLRSVTEAKEAIELADHSTVGEFLQFEMALLCDTLESTGTEEDATLERALGDSFEFVLILRDNRLCILSCFLDFVDVLVQRVDMTEHEAREQHRREATGHSERLIVRLFGQQEQKDVVLSGSLEGEVTILVASDIDVCYILAVFVSEIDRSDALRAVTGTCEADEQQRALFVEQVIGMGDDIGGGHGAHITPHTAHNRQKRISDERRSTGTGENNIGVRG